ncbi:hypothetical protein BC937DRAFT_89499 [Endogone sp. FLAS-F59071]|nr:hypothetical protein BC937DRAFT_89499 [Endogone sp. FLAS-F59071]|eukprot:RUS17786.1 hypothetical protein BC937DRAFT_89499 [Endogone sp. FLAS-F59071]
MAVNEGFINNAQLLLKLGAEFNTRALSGQSPLHIIIRYEYTALLDKLYKQKVDVNCADVNGETPLHLALQSNNHTVWELIAYQVMADFTDTSKQEDTPHNRAMEWVKICRWYGIDSNTDVFEKIIKNALM